MDITIIGTGNMGRAIATRALAGAGARVVVPARRRSVAEAALAGIDGVEVDELELADMDSVRAFSRRFLASGRDIDLMINNAGIMAVPQTRVGPGWEAQFATNHLGHHALVNHLWPAIEQGGARVVSVSSHGHHASDIHWDDVHFEHGYDKWQAYGQAKTANVLFAVQLDILGRDAGVRAFSVHPGTVRTQLTRSLSEAENTGLAKAIAASPRPVEYKTPRQGAATQVWAATSPRLAGMGGVYCEDCDIAELADAGANGVAARAVDPERAARLWALSAELTGADAFA